MKDLPPELAARLAALSPAQRELLQRRLQQQGFDVSGVAGPVGIDLDAETVLSADIHPRWSGAPARTPREVLVTGATGFLAAHLVADLLRHTEARVTCLVRAPNVADGLRRLRENFARYELTVPLDRVVAVPSDLAQPRLALASSEYERLADEIDAIYHSAAFLNFVYPYEGFVPPNVAGTRELIRLACDGRPKAFHHVSTTAFFSLVDHRDLPPVIAEEGTLDHGRYCLGGYSQSKWVAEKLVVAAGARGLPTTIHRCGLIAGHGGTGVSHVGDILTRMMKGFVELKSAPALDMSYDVGPVDFVSRAIVHLSLDPTLYGRTFHVIKPEAVELRQFVEGVRAFGHPVAEIPVAEWKERLTATVGGRREHALAPLLPFFAAPATPSGLSLFEAHLGRPRVDAIATGAMLARAGIVLTRADAALHAGLGYLARVGFLPPGAAGHLSKDTRVAEDLVDSAEDESTAIEELAMTEIDAAVARGVTEADVVRFAADIDVWQTSGTGRQAVQFIYRRLRVQGRKSPSHRALLETLMDREGWDGYVARITPSVAG